MSQRRVIAGRYELDVPIGRGGMGEVWSAYDQRLDRRLAVKLLRRDLLPVPIRGAGQAAATRTKVLVERFVREARITARVEHPGVPAVYDAGSDQGELFLAMQFVDGTSLADRLAERGAMACVEAAAVAAQLASALASAHDVALVHRDLKPGNIVITTAGEVKVLDFGIAAVLDPEITRLTVDETLGSPAYMAPEQVVNGVISPRADLYALGCVLHEMICGRPPFEAPTSFGLMDQHVNGSPTPLHLVRDDVPDDVEALVLELLAKDPARRPADAGSVYRRLVSLLPTAVTDPESRRVAAHDPLRPFRQPLAPTTDKVLAGANADSPPRADAGTRTDGSGRGGRPAAPDIARIRSDAADLVDAGRFTQAAEMLTAALAVLPDDVVSGEAERELVMTRADTLLIGESYAEALADFRYVLDALSPDDDLASYCRSQIATCLAALGLTGEALSALRAVCSEQNRSLGPVHADTVATRRQIALLTASSGDLASAIDQLVSLIDDIERIPGVPTRAEAPDVGELRRLVTHLSDLVHNREA